LRQRERHLRVRRSGGNIASRQALVNQIHDSCSLSSTNLAKNAKARLVDAHVLAGALLARPGRLIESPKQGDDKVAEAKQPDICAIGVAYIDAQLMTLYTHASLLAQWIEDGSLEPDLSAAAKLLEVRNTHPEAHAHSDDGTPTKPARTDAMPGWPALQSDSQRMAFALHVPCANALIAVASFFDAHRLSASRAPEVQFLMRAGAAALNGNTFSIGRGEYIPHAAFGGRVIDETLDGQPLFSDDARTSFITFGDVAALLFYLRKLLRSMQTTISAGDAG
jgi:hypothetical protein